MENYRLSTRISSADREYLVQTANDPDGSKICTTIFADGVPLDSIEDPLTPNIQDADLRELVKNTHRERQDEIRHLFARFEEVKNSEDTEQLDSFGQALAYRQMFSEAEVLLRRAVELEPDNNEALSNLGQILMSQQRFADAAEVLAKCAELKPKFADYHNSLGEALLGLGSCKRAVIEFDEAIALNLYYGDTYYNKAIAFILNAITREDFQLFSEYNQKTMDLLERAAVIAPDYQTQTFAVARKLLEEGELKAAYDKLLEIREAKKRKRNSDLARTYLKYLVASDRIDEKSLTQRIRTLKDEISRNPHYPDLHYELAIAYTLLGRFIHNKAITEYQEALRLNPSFVRAQQNLKLAENELRGFDNLIKAVTR